MLGYESDRTHELADSSPLAFLELVETQKSDAKFDQAKALFAEWKSADILFQLTSEDLAATSSLFKETDLKPGLLQSYLFFSIELTGKNYARGKLTGIARQINRVFPMPVMVLIRHGDATGSPILSIAVINRRQNKLQASKDVLEKVTLIRNISLSSPHRGHLDILASFALQNLVHPKKLPIQDFDTLHAAWEEIFNVELLNKRFYRELANWYFWALPQVEFPADIEKDDEKRRATGLIRLLTRLIFCWFLKEKGLIPEKLFHPTDLTKLLKGFDPESETSSVYYQAILQNLFFATLNQRMGKDSKGNPYRVFATDEGFLKNKTTYDVNNLYRYEKHFAVPQDEALALFADIPFLNGGLFECLDQSEEGTGKKRYLDGFSRNPKMRPHVPDRLFFDSGETADLAEVYGDKKRKAEKVTGLISILNRYKFTIVENTPIDQEIALDPELLGKVFENLLASYNEETKTTARKQTGSFYTPRPIVEYMVDESLKAHLTGALTQNGMRETDAQAGLDILFAYTEREHPFREHEVAALLDAIHTCKILDPACGSGAFPMGMLQKLVYIIHKLDPDNARWKQLQIDTAAKIPDPSARDAAITAIERDFADNEDDYGRKLYLIENCLYGVDIQPIAIQISKLRFFISLVCDQRTNRSKKENHGIRPLPNLETKFVAADTLIGLPIPAPDLFVRTLIDPIEAKIEFAVHSHFGAQNRKQKLKLQDDINRLQSELAEAIATSLGAKPGSDVAVKARHIAKWNRFNPQIAADFFDTHWMFGRSLGKGFDIVFGNPPYIQIQKFPAAQKAIWQSQGFKTYAATADIYCLFYERGAQLLKPGGHLAYITSNKWMRAGYGDQLRGFLSSEVDTVSVLDFGMAQNFGAATTYTCIVQLENQPYARKTLSCYAVDDRAAMADPASYFEQNRVLQDHLNDSPWVVISKERQRIKELVEAQGVPLEKWAIQINYGIKTGFNDAFYITQDQRDAMVAEDPKCADLIVPLLRGRDLARFQSNWDGTWMINTHNGLRSAGVPPVDVRRNFPAIWKHLIQWETELKTRQDKGNHWSNLRNCAYLREFSQPKIIYQDIAQSLPFYFDDREHFFFNNTLWMMNGDASQLPYVTAMLNSSVFRCCFRDNFPEYSGNAYRLFAIFMEKIPVKKPTDQQSALFEKLVPLIQFAKRTDELIAAQFLEDLIDACVMECYFREHMAERDLLFLDDLAPHLSAYDPSASESQQSEFIAQLHRTLNAPTSKIRNRLLRISADSPDLLAVIKEEGAV
ncbi:Eco57I restriction-modification methylase domain-containing protein [Verrucomicrobium sp. BvORR106]|uniref:Eco57I restriction-modification methylase domain-containing protein n=1 Tax=Verrucomicrobium sp. BvORR106 TaxID=1403819 RepID=UPI000A9D79C6|nr:Eco57I restriction-modification methylase domain-containing protein [Verrucomicrobium sp. BvORR106]